MDWIRASRMYELTKACDDYIYSLNMHVAAIAFTKIPEEQMEIFCEHVINKYDNVEFWNSEVDAAAGTYKKNSPSFYECIDGFINILNYPSSKMRIIYILGIYKEPNDSITISYKQSEW